MIKNIRHFGIYVKPDKFDKSKQFYLDLGLEVIYEKKEDWGDPLDTLNVVKFKIEDTIFEVIGTDNPYLMYQYDYNSHVAFSVDNLEEVYNKLKDKTNFYVKPRLSPDKNNKVAFCVDPNDFIIELVEEL